MVHCIAGSHKAALLILGDKAPQNNITALFGFWSMGRMLFSCPTVAIRPANCSWRGWRLLRRYMNLMQVGKRRYSFLSGECLDLVQFVQRGRVHQCNYSGTRKLGFPRKTAGSFGQAVCVHCIAALGIKKITGMLPKYGTIAKRSHP